MTRRWVIPGYRVGRICTEHEVRECFGFDFSRATWHLYGRPVGALLRLRAAADGGDVRCRLHESQGMAQFAEATIPGNRSVDVPLPAAALDEIWLSATECFGVDGIFETAEGQAVHSGSQPFLILETNADVALCAA